MRVYLFLLGMVLWGLATAAMAAPNGKQLYQRNCAACHGENGDGGVGVPLSLPDFQYSVPDSYLARTIRLGRPGRVMPAFPRLSAAEVTALVKYIRTWAPGRGYHLSAAPIHGDPVHGRQLFAKYCASCHGAQGQGGTGTGVTFSRPRNLPVMPPALNNPGFLAAATDQMIKATLMNGREGTPMVSFLKHGLSETDINDVVSYVRSFQRVAHADTAPATDGSATLSYASPYDMKTTIANIKKAIIGANFRLIRIQYLNEGMVAKGKENRHQVVIYFCNFDLLNEALAIDPRVGLFLPCRVTVVAHKGKVQVLAINPQRLSALFNNAELNQLCDRMHGVYQSILEESTL